MPRYLLVCGCARSGTSALTRYLNRHPRVALGMERYNLFAKSGGPICEALFAPDRFLDIRPGDTFYKDFSYFEDYEHIAAKYGSASIVGDKVPKYYLKYDEIFKTIPDARFVCIIRNIYDVAASYKVRAARGTLWPRWRTVPSAIEDWNLSLRQTARHVASGRVHIVPYEEFFLKGTGAEALWTFLGLDPDALGEHAAPNDRPSSGQSSQPKVLDALDAYRIATQADFGLYRTLISQGDATAKSTRRGG